MDAGTDGDLYEETQLTDTTVLDLDVSETVEGFLVTVGSKSEGSKNPRGGRALNSFSKAMLIAVEDDFWAAGAKAAALAMWEAAVEKFMVLGVVWGF